MLEVPNSSLPLRTHEHFTEPPHRLSVHLASSEIASFPGPTARSSHESDDTML